MVSVISNSCVCVHRFRNLFNALDLKDSVFSGDWVIPDWIVHSLPLLKENQRQKLVDFPESHRLTASQEWS